MAYDEHDYKTHRRRVPRPLVELPVEAIAQVAPEVHQRLRNAGLTNMQQVADAFRLEQTHQTLKLAGLSEFEIYRCYLEVVRWTPDPKGAA